MPPVTGDLRGNFRAVFVYAPGGSPTPVFESSIDWTRDSPPNTAADSSSVASVSMTQRPVDFSFSAMVTSAPLGLVTPAEVIGNASAWIDIIPHGQVMIAGTLTVAGDAGATLGAAARAVARISDSGFAMVSETTLSLGTRSGSFSDSVVFSFLLANPCDGRISYFFDERMDSMQAARQC